MPGGWLTARISPLSFAGRMQARCNVQCVIGYTLARIRTRARATRAAPHLAAFRLVSLVFETFTLGSAERRDATRRE